MAIRNFTDEQLDRWIAANAKLEPEGIAAIWCKGCRRFVLTSDHKVVSRTPLWKILLWLDGHSLPEQGAKRRELSAQYKEAAKRFEHQVNIQTRLFIWDSKGNQALRIVRWDGHEDKWVVETKKKEPKKVVVKVVNKKKVKKVVIKRIRGKKRQRCKGCNSLYSPKSGRQKYCNTNCRDRANNRTAYRKRSKKGQ